MNFNKFKPKKSKNSSTSVYNLKKSIEKISKHKNFIFLLKNISLITKLPYQTIEMKSKQLINNSFDYNNFKFQENDKLYLIFYTIKNLLLFFYLYLISFLIFKKKKINIIIDNVENFDTLNIYKKYFKKKNDLLFITKNIKTNEKLKKKSLSVYKIPINKEVFKNNFKSILKLTIFTLGHDLFTKGNFTIIFFKILLSYIKYFSLFTYISSNFLIHNRIYLSCPIKNFLHKKFGGKKVITLQTHIIENSISLFKDVDILCAWGTNLEIKKKIINLGGKVNQLIPIGSLKMESSLDNKTNLNQLKNIDILILGVNPTLWIQSSNQIKHNYYKFIELISQLPTYFENLNIVYKHHENFTGDAKEEKILKISGIKKIIIDENNLNTYHYLLKSKLVLSFCSSMIAESLSLQIPSFYIDLNNSSQTFFRHLESFNKIKINSKKKLFNIIELYLKNKKRFYLNTNTFCLKHEGVTKRLIKILN